MLLRALTFTATILATTHIASAQDADGLAVGAVMMSSNSIYEGVNTATRVYPNISYKSGPLEIDLAQGIAYSFDNIFEEPLRISLRPSFGPYSDNDSAALAGMKRNMIADIIVATKFNILRGTDINVELGTELTGKHNGHIADVSLSQFIPLFGRPIIIEGGAKIYDSKRSNYLYGVYASEQTASRAAYSMDTTTTPYVSVSTFFSISDSVSGFASLNLDFMPNAIQNSPIVSERISSGLLVGIAYKF